MRILVHQRRTVIPLHTPLIHQILCAPSISYLAYHTLSILTWPSRTPQCANSMWRDAWYPHHWLLSFHKNNINCNPLQSSPNDARPISWEKSAKSGSANIGAWPISSWQISVMDYIAVQHTLMMRRTWLRCVERLGWVPDVLSGKEHAEGKAI